MGDLDSESSFGPIYKQVLCERSSCEGLRTHVKESRMTITLRENFACQKKNMQNFANKVTYRVKKTYSAFLPAIFFLTGRFNALAKQARKQLVIINDIFKPFVL